jgi:hypothetical protein
MEADRVFYRTTEPEKWKMPKRQELRAKGKSGRIKGDEARRLPSWHRANRFA